MAVLSDKHPTPGDYWRGYFMREDKRLQELANLLIPRIPPTPSVDPEAEGGPIIQNWSTSVLEEAKSIVGGARQADYGTPLENHQRTADLWNAYLGTQAITPRMVCMMNVLQKVSRDRHAPKHDNLVDIAGYAENAHLCAHPPAPQVQPPKPPTPEGGDDPA